MFPKGLGKGFDASLLGKWLAELLPTISPDSVPDTCPSCSILCIGNGF